MQNVLKDKDVEVPSVDKNAVPGLRNISISEIPLNDIATMQNDLNSGLGMGGGGAPMGGGDLGAGGMNEPSMGDMGLENNLGGAAGGAPMPSGQEAGLK